MCVCVGCRRCGVEGLMYDDEGDRVSAPFGFRSASSDGSFFSKKKKKKHPDTWPELGERWPEPTC